MADIAINPVTRRVQFTGNTGTGPFAFTFNVLQQSDITVYKNNVLQTLTTDYTISLNANGTGSVTLVTALVATDVLVIVGGRELSRTTDFVTGGDLLASSINEQLDSNVIMSQQLDERVSRAMRAQPGDELTDLYIPLKADRADKILSFDTEGGVSVQSASDLLTGSVLGANYTKVSYTGNGTQTAYSTSVSAGSKNNIQVYIDGVYQNKDTFSISGTTLTFTEAPPLNSAIEFIVGNAITSVTGDASGMTYSQGSTGDVERTVQAKLQETVSVKDFGAVGDGVTDDTAAIQAAFTAANGKRLLVAEGSYLVTSQITIPNNIYVFGDGSFVCTGDQDYWFYTGGSTSVIFEAFKAEVTLAFASRSNLNRVLRIEDTDYTQIDYAEITGASTAIHNNGGDTFICKQIVLYEVYGIDPQYGYGINSSAKITKIENLLVENTSSSHGRHAIYINGDNPVDVFVGNVYVKNFARNPIQFNPTLETGSEICSIYLGSVNLEETNIDPIADTSGCIHFPSPSPSSTTVVNAYINNLFINGTKNTVLSCQRPNLQYLYVNHVYVENTQTQTNTTRLTFFRNAENVIINRFYAEELASGYDSVLYFRDISNAVVNDAYLAGSNGSQVISHNGSTVTVGNVDREDTTISVYSGTGSTIKFKQLQQTFEYAGAAPTSGTYERGDIVWDSTPSAGGFVGWVCVTAGTPGTWKTFGAISS